jgi:hypothetical protein
MASALCKARAASRDAVDTDLRRSAFRFLAFFFRPSWLKAQIVRIPEPPPAFSGEDRCGEQGNSCRVTMTRMRMHRENDPARRHGGLLGGPICSQCCKM